MKTMIVRTSIALSLAACGAMGCSSEAAQDSPQSSQTEAIVAEIPARSGVSGAVVWRFGLQANGGRAWAVDADGKVVIELELTQSENEVTIVNLTTQEHVVIGSDGTVRESSLEEGSQTPSLLDGIATDVDTFRRDNPEQPLSCGWDFAKMWGWCAATAGTCNHVLGWACVATGGGCVNAAGDFYFNCLSS